LDLLEVGGGRDDDTSCTHDRLGDERGDRLRTLVEDELLEVVGHAGGELLLALPRLAEAVVVRTGRRQDAGDRQVAVLVHRRHPGEAGAGNRDAMVTLYPTDDLLALTTTERIVIVPAQLALRV